MPQRGKPGIWGSTGSHINSSYTSGLSLGSWKFPVSWQVGMNTVTLLLWASGSPARWQASQQGFSSLQQGWKSHFFWPPQGFMLHGPEIHQGLGNQDCPKNPAKVMLWNPQPDALCAAQPFGFSSVLGGVDAPSSCVSCSALGTTWLYPEDNFCFLPMATRHVASFQPNNHFNLSGWQLSGFGDAVTSNFHMFWTAALT